MTHEEAFLKAVIDNPEDDAPRLQFADWLEEQGQVERSEFIRVQIELAKYRDYRCPKGSLMGKPILYEGKPCPCRQCGLVAREQELLDAVAPGCVAMNRDRWARDVVVHLGQLVKLDAFRRGFVERIQCPAEVWLAHADALTATCPLREVRLTTHADPDELFSAWRARGWVGGLSQWTDRNAEAMLLASCWPRITFALPTD